MSGTRASGSHSTRNCTGAGPAASAVSATTTAMWSASHRLTSAGTSDRPVSPSPTSTGWSFLVSPYSLTGTSAAVRTSTTPSTSAAGLGVHGHHAGMRLVGEHGDGMQRIGRDAVAGVAGNPGDLVDRIVPDRAGADTAGDRRRHHRSPLGADEAVLIAWMIE